MSKKIILLLIISCSNLIFGQNEKEELKQFLPFIVKAIQENKTEKLDQRTVGVFDKPWLSKKIDKNIAQEIINSINQNSRFNIEKDYEDKWNIDFFSQIESNSFVTDVYNSNGLLCNLFIEVSEIQFIDDDNNSVLETEERKVKINQSTVLNFHTGAVQNNFPIKKDYDKITGSINLNLKEFQKINFVELKANDKNKTFDLGSQKGLKLLKIENNKAYIYLPNPIENIMISSTNKKDEEYGQHAKMPIPKKVFEYANGANVNDNSTKSLIEELTVNDLKKEPQILMYQTNGTIENLYIYMKLSPISLTSKTLEIKL